MQNGFGATAPVILMTGEPRRSIQASIERETRCLRLNLSGKLAKETLHRSFLREVMQMPIFRLYSGSDGQSHLEELSFSFVPGEIAEQSPTQAASGISFSRIKPGAFSDWHNAPRRQYVITLAGAIEIGLGDGSVHRLGPGDGILAEDLTGKGHTTRAIGNNTRVVVIPLAG
jgi:quercetin dioxygenase-like cupin family protein